MTGRGRLGFIRHDAPAEADPETTAKAPPIDGAEVLDDAIASALLPEDDVEEIDPEPALARILDHEHDAIVVGPGLRPGLATAELVRLLLTTGEDAGAAPILLDAEALRSIATIEDWWEGDRRPS